MTLRITRTEYTNDYHSGLKYELGGLELDFVDGEHEDNNLGRNFEDCYSIVDLIKAAHELGQKGEPLEIEEVERKVGDDEDGED